MSRCGICGGEGAFFICSRCNRLVCSECFDSKRGLCIRCLEEAGEASPFIGLRRSFGTASLGFALIVFGMILMVAASVISWSGGGGVIIIPPFFIGTVEGTAALTIILLIMAVTILMIFLPWILEPGRFVRVGERTLNLEGKTVKAEDYIITLRMPGFREDDIEVQTFAESLTVRAYKDGRLAFSRSYSLPKGMIPEKVRYRCEDGFLVIRVTLRREDQAT
ncbi:MAG TPA: Hsp20 family protein [Candidatus Bathyarchaeota archaeon]|nr:Hsp20 family protein [Candidatus Bathyarchaeota archaeon]